MRIKPILAFSVAAVALVAAYYWPKPKPKQDPWQAVDDADKVILATIHEATRKVRFTPDSLYD